MADPRIIPGVWVDTCYGPAVAIEVSPHRHRMGPPEHLDKGGICHCACESDACAEAMYVAYRYEAHRYTYDAYGKVNGNEPKAIWVVNGDLTAGCGVNDVTFLRDADDVSTYVLTLTGPYGEGPILPPRPPVVEPAGPVRAERASAQEALSLEYNPSLSEQPNFLDYDLLDPAVKAIYDEWEAWKFGTLTARLAKIGWTKEEFLRLCEAEMEALNAEMREYGFRS